MQLIIRPGEYGLPTPLVTVTGEALVRQVFPMSWQPYSCCIEHVFIVACLIRVCCASAASKQQVSTHAHWVIKDGVVIDIIPDFIDLTRHGVIMPPPESCTSAPSYASCAPMLIHVPVPPHILALPAPPLSPPAIVENASIR